MRSDTPHIPGRPRHLQVSRRAFIAGSLATVAGGAAALIAGCDDEPPSSGVAGTSASPRRPTEAPAASSRGGVLRLYNFDAAPYDSLDPHLTQFGPIVNTHAAIFSRLLRYDDEVAGTIVPDLAAALPEQADELTYIFRIHEGVRFHDTAPMRAARPEIAGRALTAEDVRQSIERQRDGSGPLAKRLFRRDSFAAVDRVEAPDERTVVVRLQRPVAPLLSSLAGRHAFVLPREVIDGGGEITHPDALIGTGPFTLESFEERVAVRLRRNPSWFAATAAGAAGGGRPYLDGYDAFFAPQEDPFQRAAFERRIVDITGFVDQAETARAHKTNLADISLEQVQAGAILGGRLLLDRPPFSDERARRALHLAFDRAALRDALFPPVDGAPSADLSGPVAPGAQRWALAAETLAERPGYRSGGAGREADLREARQLWSAAMGGDPVDLRIVFAGMPRVIPDRAVEAVRAQLQGALGVNVVSHVDLSGRALIAAAYRHNLEGVTEGAVTFSFGIEDGGVDLDDWLYPQFRSGAAANTYRLQDAQLDALLDAQRAELDPEARRRIGYDAQEYIIANVNARIDICAPIERRLVWGYVRNSRMPFWWGSAQDLADVWLDASQPAFGGRPAAL